MRPLDDGFPFESFLCGTSLVVGKATTGKSLFLRFLAERGVKLGRSIAVLDPNGDHADLHAIGAVIFGADGLLPNSSQLEQLARACSPGIVLELSGLAQHQKNRYLLQAFRVLQASMLEFGKPELLLVDEAHKLYQTEKDLAQDRVSPGLCLATFDASRFPPAILSTVTTVVGDATSTDQFIAIKDQLTNKTLIERFLTTIVQTPPDAMSIVCSDMLDKPFILDTAALAGDVETRHVRQKLRFWKDRLGAQHRFHFIEPYHSSTICAYNLKEFCRIISTIDPTSLMHHLQCRDFSRWVRDSLADTVLAQQLYAIEGKVEEERLGTLRVRIREAVEHRYAVAATESERQAERSEDCHERDS